MAKPLVFLSFIILFICCKKDGESIKSKQLSTSDQEIINYIEYCNQRYDICFDYPSNFGAQPDPLNGDGKMFINKTDSSEIILYGFIDETGNELDNQLNFLKENLSNSRFKKLEDGYEITGSLKKNGYTYHERLLVKNSEENLQVVNVLQFSHPKNKTKKFDGYWENMIDKFH